jgi:N-acetylmuramoyl-L-alanine amidase
MSVTKEPVILDHPSANHGPRPDGMAIDMLLLHYTGMRSAEEALTRLCDPASEVSAHYLIDEAGAIYRLVAEDRRAWHAGRAFWAGETDINSCSIGIEIANPGHEFGYRDFPQAQMRAVEWLCLDILSRYPIPARRVLGHSDVAPDRKEDPGELFDWAGLARAGVGIWPPQDAAPASHETPSVEEIQRSLIRLGYAVEATGLMDAETRSALLAFQRHWLPNGMTGARDPRTAWRLGQVLKAFLDGENSDLRSGPRGV